MVEAYSSMTGDLADRILAAFDAAEAEGGDIRGRQSAAIVIVGGKPTDTPWKERRIDLRVEDHPEPVQELRRLVTLRRAYDEMERGEDYAVGGDLPAAVERYEHAYAAAPDNIEISFWLGLSLAGSGRVEEGLPHLKRACLENDGWVELVRRMSDTGMIPAEAAELASALTPQQ
jgi:tetratricopeptide (TPR) repeat protein